MNLRNIISFGKNKAPRNDFSDFFSDASPKDKKKLFRKVVARANEDQRDLIEQSKRLTSKARIS